jgi:transcriptional regulator with XRE-family HTH domain
MIFSLLFIVANMGFKENLKSELAYSGMLVKELAAKSGVNKHSIDNYLNKRGQTPLVEAAVKIAQALDVSVEYLVTGKESAIVDTRLRKEAQIIARQAEQLNDKNRKFVIDFIKWIKSREGAD